MNAPFKTPDTLADAPLDAAQHAHYERFGWVAARGFFNAQAAAQIAGWSDEVMALPEVPGEHMVYYEQNLLQPGRKVVQRVENFCPYHAGFDGLVRGGRLLAAVEQLLGGPAVLFKEKINFKLPGGGGFEPHQDQQAGWSAYAPMFITALACIDRATRENGCLEMADAPRFAGLIGAEWRPLSDAEMASFALLPVECEPGDVLFFDSYAPHASKPNLTAAQRRILYLTYNRAEDGDHRTRYFAEKRANFPPEIERSPGVEYKFRV
jgi:2-aminoethylphosphonate dioxygenase